MLLAWVTPPRWLAAGIVAMAAADTALVVSDLLQKPNNALNAAHPAADDLRKIRMIEAHHRNPQAPRHVPCAPGGMEGIAGLDEARLERAHQARPAARIDRQAVIEGARHGTAGQRADVAARDVIRLAGNHDRMLPRGVGGEPGVPIIPSAPAMLM